MEEKIEIMNLLQNKQILEHKFEQCLKIQKKHCNFKFLQRIFLF